MLRSRTATPPWITRTSSNNWQTVSFRTPARSFLSRIIRHYVSAATGRIRLVLYGRSWQEG